MAKEYTEIFEIDAFRASNIAAIGVLTINVIVLILASFIMMITEYQLSSIEKDAGVPIPHPMGVMSMVTLGAISQVASIWVCT